jgi:hypothetical protein
VEKYRWQRTTGSSVGIWNFKKSQVNVENLKKYIFFQAPPPKAQAPRRLSGLPPPVGEARGAVSTTNLS